MNGKLKEIKEILKSEYKDKMTDAEINTFARELNYSVFVAQYDLEDIAAVVSEHEEKAGIEDSKWCYIFGSVIDLLEDGEKTARRLYKSFMYEFDLWDTFLKLYNYNAEYLNAEELAEVKEKATGLFDKQLLKMYDIIDDED